MPFLSNGWAVYARLFDLASVTTLPSTLLLIHLREAICHVRCARTRIEPALERP